MIESKVYILCLADNQRNYIMRALVILISQTTKYEHENVNNDDASNDDTAGIVGDYPIKYSEIIKTVFHSENQYSNGMRGLLIRSLLPFAKAKYILCAIAAGCSCRQTLWM